jgi:hypothetical protein
MFCTKNERVFRWQSAGVSIFFELFDWSSWIMRSRAHNDGKHRRGGRCCRSCGDRRGCGACYFSRGDGVCAWHAADFCLSSSARHSPTNSLTTHASPLPAFASPQDLEAIFDASKKKKKRKPAAAAAGDDGSAAAGAGRQVAAPANQTQP